MIITTLVLCFLLSLLPLVIGTHSFRYVANFYSRGILALSAVGFLLGLTQFTLLLGTFYSLFPAGFIKQAPLAIQYVNISGGIVMVIAGILWIGYFRALMRNQAQAEPQVPSEAVKTSRQRRRKAEPTDDLFADELLTARSVRLAAEISPKKKIRIRQVPRKKTD